jgi:ABC-type glycerol-3-phosphate transport system permease component
VGEQLAYGLLTVDRAAKEVDRRADGIVAAQAREHAQDSELMMAGPVMTILPVLLLFLAMQPNYIQGMVLGSVKG